MDTVQLTCLHCPATIAQRPNDGKRLPFVCDLCTERVRTHRLLPDQPGGLEHAPKRPVSTSKPRRTGKARTAMANPSTSATLAVLILVALGVLLAGCTAAWTGSVSLDVDPAVSLARPAVLPSPGGNLESLEQDLLEQLRAAPK